MSYVPAFKCHCRQQIDDQNEDRIVTEACRNCFIKDESGCLSSKTCDDQRQSISKILIKNVVENSDIIQIKPMPLISRLDHVGNGTNRSISNPKDIRILEDVIIKPFIEIPSSGCDDLTFPRLKEYQKFKYPSHVSWQLVDGRTEFECKICKKSFRSKSNRKYHLYCDETVEKPFNCKKCSKKFATKNHLEYHENRHNNVQHKCNECDRTFLSRISLKKHSKVHTKDFKYICDHCDMKYYNKSELILHMYSHKQSPLPFQCDTCNKSFAAKFKLNQHSETHKGVKSHCCQFCGKKFTRNSSLTIHMLTHSNVDIKYECSLCSKSFDRQRSHDRHMKIKHGSTVFRCPLCEVQSGRKDNILRHIRNLHSNENFDDMIKKISKTAARLNVPDPIEQPLADPNVKTINDFDVAQVSNTCQYQSVIQFAGRSKTPPVLPMNVNVECSTKTYPPTKANVSINNDDNIEKSLYNKELRVDLSEPNDSAQKISNISIYRQLLSPYLRPPSDLHIRNGSQEQEKHIGYQVQSDRLPQRKENVDIYRSILMSTTDQDQQTVIQNNSVGIVQEDVELTNDKPFLVIHGQSSEYFSEMHWRKRTSQCFNHVEQ